MIFQRSFQKPLQPVIVDIGLCSRLLPNWCSTNGYQVEWYSTKKKSKISRKLKTKKKNEQERWRVGL